MRFKENDATFWESFTSGVTAKADQANQLKYHQYKYENNNNKSR